MTRLVRPNLTEITTILRKHVGLIVHFSGTPKGAGSDFQHRYPDDLHAVISGYGQSGLSCSVVMPTDEFEDLNSANATGCIGVILGLKSEQSIVDAHPNDCGSSMVNVVRETPHARDMSAADIDATVTGRSDSEYNEWVIAGYDVLGVLAVAPYRISADQPISFPADMPDYLRSNAMSPGFRYLSIDEIVQAFPDQPIFSFVAGGTVRLDSGNWTPVEHEELYPYERAGL